MPTYDYRCNACGHEFEEFQSFSEKVLVTCPKCKKKKLQRLFGTGSAILFKGSGFYETDYRSDGYKASAKADSEKSTDTSSKPTASGSTDSSTSKPTGETAAKPAKPTSESSPKPSGESGGKKGKK